MGTSLEFKHVCSRSNAWCLVRITVLGVVYLVLCTGFILRSPVNNGALTTVKAHAPQANSRAFVHGIFTVPEKGTEREIHRSTWMTSPLVCENAKEKPDCEIVVYFVTGIIPNASRALIKSENATRADMIQLDIIENMNSGKSFEWFRFAASRFKFARFISKGDMDTIVFPGEVLRSVSHVSRGAQGIYGGLAVDWNLCGRGAHCPYGWIYMAGGFYFVSQDLVQWLGTVNNTIVRDNSEGHEDLQVGKCLYLSKIRILYLSWGLSKRAWAHPVKNMSRFFELHRNDNKI